MNSLLEVENLTKSYGRNRVIDNLYLSLSSGEIVIIRGANGSGKTTLLSIISSLVSSDSGRVKILGNDLKLNPHICRSELAFVAHQPFLYSQLTVRENLEFSARLHSLKDVSRKILDKTTPTAEQVVLDVMRHFGFRRNYQVAEYFDVTPQTLSGWIKTGEIPAKHLMKYITFV